MTSLRRRDGRRWLAALALAAGLGAACTFDPNIPSARVLCHGTPDCPSGSSCVPIETASGSVGVCCRDPGCASTISDPDRKKIEQVALDAGFIDAPRDQAPGADGGSDGGARDGRDGAASDADGPVCGNGRADPGETCDPPSSCPSACPPIGCELYQLNGAAATCNAVCVQNGRETRCVSGDGCCPSACTAAEDSDCNCSCGNGTIESGCGETCDPLSTCPTSCAPTGCMLRRLANPGTCQAQCVSDGMQTACVNADGCCPPGCNANNDSDCNAACGNGVIEAGEACDPPGTCPASCPAVGCTRQKLTGTAAACTARCVDDGAQTTCASGDGCCPSGCTSVNDAECACTCGNGQVEAACQETCDPLASCPAACPPMGCQLRRLVNGGTCQAQCVNDVLQTACRAAADGCCPAGCNATNDGDCVARCGNGAVESGETCDPPSSCPTSCPWVGCARKRLAGSAAACTAACVDDGTQTTCAFADGCCPTGCNANSDNDCAPRCGNGVVETGEKCDGNCPTSCPAMGCQTRRLQGTAAQCNAECVNDVVITTCANGDGCCASGCTSVNDSDCSCRCGNGVTEPACAETCDGSNCPASCPPVGCQLRTLQGTAAACTAQCVAAGMQTACANGDGCCPSACNANNDNNCTPVCGNSVVEAAEKCDPSSACSTQYDACVGDANTVRTRTGTVSNCTFECQSSARACSGTSDGFCPSACTPCAGSCATGQDIDCKLANGAACTAANQCTTACTDGHCCAASCATCTACTGSGGTCVNIARYTEDTVPANACTGNNSCDGAGSCKLDNGQACTAASGCASGFCVDGYCCESACAGTCQSCGLSGTLGLCRSVPAGTSDAACNDSNPCTNDSCGASGACAHTNNTAACNDNNACTSSDVCSNGACGGTAINCDDGNPCTNDSCNSLTGCGHTNNADPCDDGNACTTGDACSGGACTGGPRLDCDDGNPCTSDSCSPTAGCQYADDDSTCCGNGLQCQFGACSTFLCR